MGGHCRHILFAFRVEVDSTHFALDLVEADIVEALKAGPGDRAYAVVRDEEMLLPTHENVLPLRNITDHHRALARLLLEWAEGVELAPMAEIDLVGGAPALVAGDEAIFGANDFALKVCRQGGVILGEACRHRV